MLQDGKVVEEGSHHDLLNNANGLYASELLTEIKLFLYDVISKS